MFKGLRSAVLTLLGLGFGAAQAQQGPGDAQIAAPVVTASQVDVDHLGMKAALVVQ